MSVLTESYFAVGETRLRKWEKGTGPRLGFLAGLGGATRWTPFLEKLARERTVVVPSLPGFPGSDRGHERLDHIVDWIAATLDVLEGAGLAGCDLVGASVGGMLATEAAAMNPSMVRRLALLAPFGLFDEAEPVADVFASLPAELGALLCSHPEYLDHHIAAPRGESEAEWSIVMTRAADASARLLWPVPDRGLAERLRRVRCPTLVVWGSEDRVIPASYAERFVARLGGPVKTRIVAGAGHMVELDAAEETAQEILEFFA
jgi:pimeloyl-ACP methyl ester carboxylesterase